MGFTGVENILSANFTGNGGNFGISPNAGVFEAPELATSAPTTSGDYHLKNLSPAINKGNNNRIPANVGADFEGDNRILNETVDVGADERPLTCHHKIQI